MEYRKERILCLLRKNSHTAISVTEVYNQLFFEYKHDVSRKTVERDLMAMLDEGIVEVVPGTMKRFALKKNTPVSLKLALEEARRLLAVIDDRGKNEQIDESLLKVREALMRVIENK